jgi:hypothetical protein
MAFAEFRFGLVTGLSSRPKITIDAMTPEQKAMIDAARAAIQPGKTFVFIFGDGISGQVMFNTDRAGDLQAAMNADTFLLLLEAAISSGFTKFFESRRTIERS